MSHMPRILIVESNDVLRAMLFTILRHQPVGVDTAASAETALKKIKTCHYSIVVIDLDTPNSESFLTGFREERPDAPTFVLAIRDPSREEPLDRELIAAVMNKPLEIDTLAELVRECAHIVPRPENPRSCPPAENDIRARMERGPYLAN